MQLAVYTIHDQKGLRQAVVEHGDVNSSIGSARRRPPISIPFVVLPLVVGLALPVDPAVPLFRRRRPRVAGFPSLPLVPR